MKFVHVRASVLLIGGVAISACSLFGPSESIEGFWTGRGGGLGGSYSVYLKLRQNDNIITGIACYSGGNDRQQNVSGSYPQVNFSGGWAGKLEKSGDIVATKISDLERFVRTDSAPAPERPFSCI
jgi:hypothetical protein